MPEPSARPIADPEALGHILYEAWDDPPEPDPRTEHDLFTATAVLIRDAILPAGWVVVPKALLRDVLLSLNALELASTYPDLAERLVAALARECP